MKIFIKVRPNSLKTDIIQLSENRYLVSLTSNPEKNKANLELIRVLSKKFSVSSKNIIIKAGLTNKEKIVEVKDEI